MEMKVLIAIDSFKGCLSSAQAGEAALKGLPPGFEGSVVAVADGGEGMAEAVRLARGGSRVAAKVTGPDLLPVEAAYALCGREAFIDFAAASGLTLSSIKNPMKTTSFGSGQLIADAFSRGAQTVFLGLGGSATNDAALGLLQALGLKILDESGGFLPAPFVGADLAKVRGLDASQLKAALDGHRIVCLADVDSPLAGPLGATRVFAPQKGASTREVDSLENWMRGYGDLLKNLGFIDVFSLPGGGAAGGAGASLATLAGAALRPGAETVFDLVELDSQLADADLVITGEGRIDSQTGAGKLPAAIAARAKAFDVPVIAIAGAVADGVDPKNLGFIEIFDINAGLSGNPLFPATASRRVAAAVGRALSKAQNLGS